MVLVQSGANLEDKMAFDIYRKNSQKVIRDLYGKGTENSKLMLEKLKNCKSETQITNLLVWGRNNLLWNEGKGITDEKRKS